MIAGSLIFSKEAPTCSGPRSVPESDRGAAGEAAVGPRSRGRRQLSSERGVRRVLRPDRQLPARLPFANELDFQAQRDDLCDHANARMHRTTRAVPAERLSVDRERMRPPWPRSRNWIDGSSDGCGSSRICALTATAIRLSPGWPVGESRGAIPAPSDGSRARHRRVGVSARAAVRRHRTITALEHARALKQLRGQRTEPEIKVRPPASYDQLIAARGPRPPSSHMLIDRLVHHAKILALKRESYRLRDEDLNSLTPATNVPAAFLSAHALGLVFDRRSRPGCSGSAMSRTSLSTGEPTFHAA